MQNGCVLLPAAPQREMLDFGKGTGRFVLICGRGRLATRSRFPDTIANVCVCCLPLPTSSGSSQPCQSVTMVRALPLSLVKLRYFVCRFIEAGMGRMAGPRMSQQDGNQCVLIKATNLRTRTSRGCVA